MTEKLKKELINLALNIFDDYEYNNFIKFLNNKNFNKIRLMVDEKISYLQVISELEAYSSVTDVQLTCANKLEDHIIDLYVSTLDCKSSEY